MTDLALVIDHTHKTIAELNAEADRAEADWPTPPPEVPLLTDAQVEARHREETRKAAEGLNPFSSPDPNLTPEEQYQAKAALAHRLGSLELALVAKQNPTGLPLRRHQPTFYGGGIYHGPGR